MYSKPTLAWRSSYILLFSLCTLTAAYTQQDSLNNNFNDGMGIWAQSSQSSIVNSGPNEEEKWLLLQKGIGQNSSEFHSPHPHIISMPIDLTEFCGVDITFDMMAMRVESGTDFFVEVSDDGGETFRLLREIEESQILRSGESFVAAQMQNFQFPVRSFLSSQMVFRLTASNMSEQSQIFIDNIKFEGKNDEDNLLAIWQMGSLINQNQDKITPLSSSGNCLGVEAYPLQVSDNSSETHFDVEGFNQGIVPTENLSNLTSSQNNGALCYELTQNKNGLFTSLSFSLTMSPGVRGQISGFEFVEKAVTNFNGQSNNYPTHFDLKIYKGEKLIFTQSNIATSRDWSERVFRLSHIKELQINRPEEFTFELTPLSIVDNGADLSVWFVDEVKVLGGCCEVDCDLIEIDLNQEHTRDGIILIPEINEGEDACVQECVGNITNQGAETLAVGVKESLGWSYSNNAATVTRDEALMSLPENFDEHSFDLMSGMVEPSAIESDVINLCPGETYAVCFEHLGQVSGEDGVAPKFSFSLDGGKQRDAQVNSDLTRTCMSFVATSDHHRIAISSEDNSSRQQPSHNYIDNITVNALSVGEAESVGVAWGKSQLLPVNVTTAVPNRNYHFRLLNVVDSTQMFNYEMLYSMCFDVTRQFSSEEASAIENLVVSIGEDVLHSFKSVSEGGQYCINFLTGEREHQLRFGTYDANGMLVDNAQLGFSKIWFATYPMRIKENRDVNAIEWTLPDGSKSSDYELQADQEGDYQLSYENCNACTKYEIYTLEFDKEVCPSLDVISCDESLTPEVNSDLALRTPTEPFSIGDFGYEDTFIGGACITSVERKWTVERLLLGSPYDTVTCLHTIEILDRDGPVFPQFPDQRLSCEEELPDPVWPSVYDNCSEELAVDSEDIVQEGSGCPSQPVVITRHWTAIDVCGNVSTATEKFEVVYELPKIECPPSKQVTCFEDIASTEPDIAVSCDDLDVTYFTNLNLSAGSAGCQGAVYEMTYTAIDACERSASCVQVFELTGQELEITCPATVTLECLEDFDYGVPTYSSSCNAAVSIHNHLPQLAVGNDLCDGAFYEVEYIVVDACGLTASCVQEIQLQNAGMSIVCPFPQIVTCPDDIVVGVPTITEPCSIEPTYVSSGPSLISGIAECSGAVYQISYTAYDHCDNEITCLQSFTIQNEGLAIICPADKTIECNTEVIEEEPQLISYCTSNPSFTVSNALATSTSLSCDAEVYTLTYTGTDNCGNVEVCMQSFQIENNGLTISCPSNAVVDCIESISPGVLTITSSCSVGYVESVSEPLLLTGVAACNGSIYELTYMVVDDCGNIESCAQQVTLSNTGLEISCPQDITVSSFEAVEPSVPFVSQACGLNYWFDSSPPVMTSVNCNLVQHMITYTIEDDCGTVLSCDQYITVNDDNNAIDALFICQNSAFFSNLDCDQGGMNDEQECIEGLDPKDPCDDVSFDLVTVDVACHGEASGSIEIIVNSGNPPYEFSLDNQNWTTSTQFDNLVAGIYNVYIRTTQGPYCEYQFAQPISEPALSPAYAGDDKEVCIGYDATLVATGGVAYLWSTGAISNTIVVSPLETTTYTVTVTQADGCYNMDSVEVVVNENNSANAGDDLEICSGEMVFLEASGGQSYVWSNGNQTAGILIAPIITSIYSVTVTDLNGCTDVDEVEIIVNENTTSVISPNTEICYGEQVDVTASGGVSYLWSTGETTAAISVSPGLTTLYQVTVTDNNGCTAEEESTVLVHPLPVANAGPDNSLCIGETTSLSASGGSSYTWSTGETTQDIVITLLATSTYSVTVTDTNGCTDDDDVTIEVFDLPTPVITGAAELCANEAVQLTASGGVNYVWSDGSTSTSIFVSPMMTTIYSVTVADINGCMATTDHTVTVNVNSLSTISPDVEICLNEQVDLTATGRGSYLWSTGETTSAISVAPTATSTYVVTITDDNGCSAVLASEVGVHQPPVADAGVDSSMCDGESVSLTATGGVIYVWSNGETSSNPTVSPSVTTTYTVTVTDAEGCIDDDEVTVEVFGLPTASIVGEEEICLNEDVELTATGGDSYLWSNGLSTETITVAPTQTAEYAVTITDLNGCTATENHIVTINTNTTSSISSDQEICTGDQVNLIAGGGVSYLWSTGETSTEVTVAPTSITTYLVTITDENGCAATEETTVDVHLLPLADAGSDSSICLGDSYTLTASGGVAYLWDGGDTSSTLVVSPLVSTDYFVTVTDSNGCQDEDEVTITINDLPILSITEEQTICEGDTVDLMASGGSSYLWSNQETTAAISVTPLVTTTYTVTVTDNNGCTDSESVEVIVEELPAADAGTDLDICIGDDITLTATGGASYLWSTGETDASIVVDPSVDTDYQVTVTGSNGCTAVDEVTVFVHEYPEADAGDFILTCYGAPLTLTATGGTNYLWSSGDTTAGITITPVTDLYFQVTVSDDYGCSSVAEVDVVLEEQPYADAGDDQTICVGGSVQLYGGFGDTYLWTPDLFLDDNTLQSPLSTPDSTIIYTLVVTDEQGCTASDDVTITVEQNDTEPPVAQCSDITVAVDSNGEAVITPGQIDNNSTDNCGIVLYELDETEFSCLLIDYTIVLTVSDAAGNEDSCSSTLSLTGPDYDCDLTANGCDLCNGGDDSIDNNNDGLPDCAFPPPSYTDIEDLWKCGVVNGVQMVWVCHAPNQSICTEYDSVYLHTSYHQDDYLGPCFAIGCFYDAEAPDDQPEHQLTRAQEELELSCKTVINDIHCGAVDIVDRLRSTLDIVQLPCTDYELTLSHTESELTRAMCQQDEITVTFNVKDNCGHQAECFSTILLEEQRIDIYPNPATDRINIVGLNGESYSIYDLEGRKVLSGLYRENLELDKLEAGVYMIVTAIGRAERFIVMK